MLYLSFLFKACNKTTELDEKKNMVPAEINKAIGKTRPIISMGEGVVSISVYAPQRHKTPKTAFTATKEWYV